MKSKRIKNFVLPSIYILIVVISFFSATLIHNFLMEKDENIPYSKSLMKDVTQSVLSEPSEQEILKPYANGTVSLEISYYNKNNDDESQQNSLIFFENTYMPCTGSFYSSENDFSVISVLDGTIKNIKDDEILGTVVEISHNNNLTTYYYSLKDITVQVGDEIKGGQVIGTSSENKLIKEKSSLLFEVYYQGMTLNPEAFYEMNINELQ